MGSLMNDLPEGRAMAVVTIRQLLDSGVHFGHQTRRWNPKMKRFIFTERNGIYIIDLQQSLTYIDKAYEFVKETVAHGGTVLFVGTKKQAQEAIAEQATRVGQPYVNQRWLGGMLTNFQTVSKRLERMKELEELDFDDVADSGFTKKELLLKNRELDKLDKSPRRHPQHGQDAVRDLGRRHQERAPRGRRGASKLGIPIVGILDTNCDPDEVDYPIPGNDDAIRSVGLLTRIIADAAAEGLIARNQSDEAAPGGPLSRWPTGSASCSSSGPKRPPPSPSRRGDAEAAEAAAPRRRRRRRGRSAADEAAAEAVESTTPPSRPRPSEICRRALRRRQGRADRIAAAPGRAAVAARAVTPHKFSRQRRHTWQTSPSPTSRRCATARHRHGRHQEGARRGRRRRREGRRDPPSQGPRRAMPSAPTVPPARASSPPGRRRRRRA